MSAGTAQWVALITDRAAAHRVNPALVEAIMSRESNGVATARGAAGEFGLMQLHPKGACAAWEKGHAAVDYMDPWHNVNVASWFLAALQSDLRGRGLPSEWRDLVIAYNAGMSYNVSGKKLPAVTESYLAYVEARFRTNVWPALVMARQQSRPVVPAGAGVSGPDATQVAPAQAPGLLGDWFPDMPAAPWQAAPDPDKKGTGALLVWATAGIALIVAFRELAPYLRR